jgi:hypothetical protein
LCISSATLILFSELPQSGQLMKLLRI